jgi:hypothetical protein
MLVTFDNNGQGAHQVELTFLALDVSSPPLKTFSHSTPGDIQARGKYGQTPFSSTSSFTARILHSRLLLPDYYPSAFTGDTGDTDTIDTAGEARTKSSDLLGSSTTLRTQGSGIGNRKQ